MILLDTHICIIKPPEVLARFHQYRLGEIGICSVVAAHALSLDATLVTHNTREFARVSGLRQENWGALGLLVRGMKHNAPSLHCLFATH